MVSIALILQLSSTVYQSQDNTLGCWCSACKLSGKFSLPSQCQTWCAHAQAQLGMYRWWGLLHLS